MNNSKISIIAIYKNKEQPLNNFIEELINQTYKNIEIIFVSSDDESAAAAGEYALKDERIKLIHFPGNNDVEFIKKTACDVADGEYICAVDNEKTVDKDLIQNLYYENINYSRNKILANYNRLYKRTFLENNSDIEEIISEKINEVSQKITEMFYQHKNEIQEEINKCYKNSENLINGKAYEVNARCNALEKLVYDKGNSVKQDAENYVQNAINSFWENNSQVYKDISKVYDYVNSEINQKGCEINKVYEEITNNYRYTEKLSDEKSGYLYNEIEILKNRIEELSKEQEVRYSNMQRLLEVTSDELKYKIEALSVLSNTDNGINQEKLAEILELEDTMNKNLDNIYSFINENNAKFYKELSELYSEVNDKINK